jgi:hypothetical protein
MNCSTIAQIAQTASPQLLQLLEPTLINLLGASGVCPSQSKALATAFKRYQSSSSQSSSSQSSNPSLAASALSVMAPNEAKLLKQLQLGNLLKQHLFLPSLPTR